MEGTGDRRGAGDAAWDPAAGKPPRRRSRWWYAAPLLLAAVGGVVAYFALRDDDPRLARNCLAAGGAITVAAVAMQAGIAAGAFLP